MSAPVAAANLSSSLKQGIYRDLHDTFKNKYPIFSNYINTIGFKIPNKGTKISKFGFKGSLGRPEIWDASRGRKHQSLEDFEVDVSYHRFEATIDLSRRDIKYDQLGDTRSHVEDIVNRFLQIPQRQVVDYKEGTLTTNRVLHKAFDGASLYSATDGDGRARFAATGGNIVTGFTKTEAGFYQMLFDIQRRFLEFKDTKREDILFGYEDVSFDKFYVEVPSSMAGIVQKLANVEFLKLDTGNTVSEGNLMAAKKYQFEFFVNNLLTDQNNFYVHLDHPRWKAFAYIQEDNVETIWADMNNSDRAREYDVESLYCDQDHFIGLWAPWTTIKGTP